MELKKLMRTIQTIGGGQFHNITWERKVSTYKGVTDIITKRTSAVLRVGVEYDHKLAVMIKRENGQLPKENSGLPYGTWKKYPYIIKSKDNFQLRLTTAQNTAFNIEYFLNGERVEKAMIEHLITANEKTAKNNDFDVFNVKTTDIISIK